LSADPADVPESEIEATIATPRRRQIVATLRAIRDAQFRRRVLRAYGHRCAFCGLQLDLLDAAHVLPVDQPDSSDATHNGVGLCALHHRAFDRALVTFDERYQVMVNEDRIAELTAASRAAGLPEFRAALRPSLWLPADQRDHPLDRFVTAANRVRRWPD
jgi:putative restriction endonuclease